MKTRKKILILLSAIVVTFSCTNDGTLIDDSEDILTGNAITGGLVNVGNPLISYVVGSGNTYTASGTIKQGKIPTTEVNVYKSFTDVVTGNTSNSELLTSIPVSSTTPGDVVSFSFDFTYESLSSGLSVNGSPLPADDGNLNIADSWTLTYEAVTGNGEVVMNANTTKVAVGTRYAGIYTVVESVYWNSGSNLGNWTGEDVTIESVNATVYRHAGLAFWDDQEYFFTVDPDTNEITILDPNDLLLNGSPAMTCNGGAGSFEILSCEGNSEAIPNDTTGEDVLEFTVGYFRGVGATREFFERLVKKVD